MTATEPSMRIGDTVYWQPDGECGTVIASDEWILAVDWDESGVQTYATCCGAVERIVTRDSRFACGRKR
jgi:hypothetical protein